jgi:hypothetical protein
MEKAEPRRLEGSSHSDESIEMSARTGIWGANRTSFKRCEILLLPKGLEAGRSGERFDIAFARLEQCTLRARGALKNFRLKVRTQLIDCRFQGGPFVSAEFGHRGPPSQPLDGWADSSVSGCDFREAELRDTRFYGVTIDQVQLPGWPHIALLGKHAHASLTGAEPQIFGKSASRSEDPLRFALDYIRDALEKASPGQPSIHVVQVRELLAGAQLDQQLREMLDRLAHPRIRY